MTLGRCRRCFTEAGGDKKEMIEWRQTGAMKKVWEQSRVTHKPAEHGWA